MVSAVKPSSSAGYSSVMSVSGWGDDASSSLELRSLPSSPALMIFSSALLLLLSFIAASFGLDVVERIVMEMVVSELLTAANSNQ